MTNFVYSAIIHPCVGMAAIGLPRKHMGVPVAMEEHSKSKKVVGIKQVRKALRERRAIKIWLADDADPALTEPLETACREAGIEVLRAVTMKELGRACSISVGAACAAEVS